MAATSPAIPKQPSKGEAPTPTAKTIRVFNLNARGERGFHVHETFIPAAGSAILPVDLAEKLAKDWPGQLSLGEPTGSEEERLRKENEELKRRLAELDSLK